MHEIVKPYIGNWLSVNNRHGTIRDFAMRETDRRSENPGGKKDLINCFLDAHEKNPDEFTYTDAVSMGTSQITAGSGMYLYLPSATFPLSCPSSSS